MIKTTGLTEIILYVEDMNGMLSFYRDVMGLEISYPQNVTEYSKEHWVTLNAGSCVINLHSGGKRRLGEDSPKIVFGVRDIEGARGTLLRREVRIGEIRVAAPGKWVCDGYDPEGNPFSITYQEQATAIHSNTPEE